MCPAVSAFFPLAQCPLGSSILYPVLELHSLFKKIFIFMYLFIWLLWVLVAADKIFSWGMQTLDCGMWDLVP